MKTAAILIARRPGFEVVRDKQFEEIHYLNEITPDEDFRLVAYGGRELVMSELKRRTAE